MPAPNAPRSVKISEDERGGWSSDRPRREGAPKRPADISTRCRVLPRTDRVRYSPGSLLLIVSAAPAEGERFAARVVEDEKALISPAKVRGMLEGRVGADELDRRADELVDAAVRKRLESGSSSVVPLYDLEPAAREGLLRAAAALRRPRHLILVEVANDQVPDDVRETLNELRRALDAGELGQEGIQTVMRLGGASVGELKRIVFRPPPRED